MNLGDDLFIKILIERYPNVNFTLLASKSTYQNIFKAKNLFFFEFGKTWLDHKIISKVFRKLFKFHYLKAKYEVMKMHLDLQNREFDGVINIGGSIFMENKDFRMKNVSMHNLFCDVFPDKPKFILGANFGPYKNQSYVEYYRNLLTKYNDVCFRDSYSKALFRELENVRCHSDVVFGGNFKIYEKIPNTIGFSVIDLTYREEVSKQKEQYIKWITNTIISAIENGKKIYLFSFCQYEGDDRAINEIIMTLPSETRYKIEAILYNGNIDEFLEKYGSIEKMYASRFHAIILSFLFRQETHPLIYSKKIKSVLDDISFTGSYTNLFNMEHHRGINEDFRLVDSIRSDAQQQFKVLDRFLA